MGGERLREIREALGPMHGALVVADGLAEEAEIAARAEVAGKDRDGLARVADDDDVQPPSARAEDRAVGVDPREGLEPGGVRRDRTQRRPGLGEPCEACVVGHDVQRERTHRGEPIRSHRLRNPVLPGLHVRARR